MNVEIHWKCLVSVLKIILTPKIQFLSMYWHVVLVYICPKVMIPCLYVKKSQKNSKMWHVCLKWSHNRIFAQIWLLPDLTTTKSCHWRIVLSKEFCHNSSSKRCGSIFWKYVFLTSFVGCFRFKFSKNLFLFLANDVKIRITRSVKKMEPSCSNFSN